jgi:diacylglycerol kinase family enzyme
MAHADYPARPDADSTAPPLQGTRVEVVLNHRSGTPDKDEVGEHVSAYLTSQGARTRILMARTEGELAAAVARAAAGDADIVVAAGGDGTVAAVAAALLDTPKVLGVLPLGTFNYFARSIGVPLDVDGALEVLSAGRTTRVSVGEVNGRVFVNNSSIGLYPALLRQRESTYRKIGRSRVASYLSAAKVLMRRPAFLKLQVTADGSRLSRRTPLLFVGANAEQMESFAIPGGECVQSGRFAVYIARPLSVARLWAVALRAFFRGLYGAKQLELVCARELQVSMGRRRRIAVALDGELAVMELPLRYRVRIDSLNVRSGPGATMPTAELSSGASAR